VSGIVAPRFIGAAFPHRCRAGGYADAGREIWRVAGTKGDRDDHAEGLGKDQLSRRKLAYVLSALCPDAQRCMLLIEGW